MIGTISVEKSEVLSKLLKMNGIPHEVLNAKHHEREAEIIARAGEKGSITIATNMAGRGTDIKLGEGVKELDGLVIIGTERHDSRRIDNQLRGRSGRQGDPGGSRFYVSMDDDLMRLFGSDKIKNLMDRLGLPDDMPIENKMITRSIEHAQKKVEGHNFDIRKHLLEYDDVMNKHREIIYARRLKALQSEDIKNDILEMIGTEAEQIILLHTNGLERIDWNLDEIINTANALLPQHAQKIEAQNIEKLDQEEKIIEYVANIFNKEYQNKEKSLPEPNMLREVEKNIMLRVIDTLWMEHIDQMTQLRESVALRGYGQRDPLMEYKREAFEMFKKLLSAIQHNVVNTLFKVQINVEAPQEVLPKKQDPANLQTNEDSIEGNISRSSIARGASPQQAVAQKITANTPNPDTPKVGRNEPCPCGSGKKYKKCCAS